MKRAAPFSIVFALVLLPFVALANTKHDFKHEKQKTIKKIFSVNSNATLKVTNDYGNIDVITWNENKIAIDVTITTSGDDEDQILKKLNEIDVEFTASESYVSAKTIFNKNQSKSWWNWTRKNVIMKINYIIKIPKKGNLDLNNDYGNINLGKMEGRVVINCDYGKITTKELMASDNSINFDYTQGCYFEFINGGDIDADYSEFTVSKTKNLDISADYTNSKIEAAENITFNCDYGKIEIENANNIDGDGDYLTTIIGNVYQSLNLEADYGSIKIDRINEKVKQVDINTDYVGIKLGYADTAHFKFMFDIQYSNLDEQGSNLEFTKKKKETFSRYYEGFYGNESAEMLIKIESDYGNITLFKN
ncbi:MAG: hypothetical protein ACK5MZ_11595 [Aestuariibaculum sp.]